MPLNLTDIYLFRWSKTTVIIFLIVLILWLWSVDKRMKDDGGEGLFGNLFGE